MRYKGGEGQWSWMLHRVTGVGVLLFLLAHILDTALIVLGPEHYNAIIAIYRLPLFRVGEVALAAMVLYHALNGIRIIIIDFWPGTTVIHKQMFWAEVALFVLLFIPAAYLMIKPLFGG